MEAIAPDMPATSSGCSGATCGASKSKLYSPILPSSRKPASLRSGSAPWAAPMAHCMSSGQAEPPSFTSRPAALWQSWRSSAASLTSLIVPMMAALSASCVAPSNFCQRPWLGEITRLSSTAAKVR